MYFRNYGLRKTWLDKCLKSPVWENPLKSNMVNAPELCWNLKDSSFTILIDHCERSCFTKVSVSICKISRLFPNTLSADGKYSLLDRDNLTQRIQRQFFQKQKNFSDFFTSFLKSSSNLESFQKKGDIHSWCISSKRESEKRG